MLKPPLSLLSDDLLDYIVKHVEKLPIADEDLSSLSLADRAFTQSCQKYLFRELKLANTTDISEMLKRLKKILDKKPTFANYFRMVELPNETAWLISDHTFISIFQLFANSPVPPCELFLGRGMCDSRLIDDPVLAVRWLTQSFLSQTLTILHLKICKNVPLPIFLAFPRLRELSLDRVGATEKSYHRYPDGLCSGRDAPSLEVFSHRNSHSVVAQLITPPPRFTTPVVLWSNLRVLTLAPRDKEGMAHLQPILDAACDTLEELYLTDTDVEEYENLSQKIFLAELVNLGNLPNLRVFAVCTIIKCNKQKNAPLPIGLRDINVVLNAIPKSNKIINLWFDFEIIGLRDFHGCRDQDWAGMFNEIIRISGGKPLELELQLMVSTMDMNKEPVGHHELIKKIMENATSLSDYPNICTHFWDPKLWERDIGPGPFPRGQVRSRCKQ
ncbi:hypothetical protein M413DRAFT_412221 [Hebeloma cylindrosporum]|uniref:F-box domain-containing protein n=1 Tax=Hebeloma cylindrosporum TaxID=76867 RepID=A0A0C2YJF1_HEBCY|nr:hypothetical protein M413DRAFT_412221 [Hebeloma cylindrosporum h7]